MVTYYLDMCADLFHWGHVDLLERTKNMCDVLLEVITAKNSGIHSKMIAAHDYAERLATTVESKLKEGERIRSLENLFSSRRSADEVNEVDLPSLAKR